mmetsp:Transcript_29128/g.38813  ORF Transcript_29128/g.38813 Transcript_29128/m.38813 type:complete len:89 (+) Transcript_29128:2027-2293(+)
MVECEVRLTTARALQISAAVNCLVAAMKDAEYCGIEVGSFFCMSALAPYLESLFEEWGISAECVVQSGLSGSDREMKIERESRSMYGA